MSSLGVDQVENELKTYFNDYWSMFFMSGESESTSHEWARSQMIEVSEALFWTAFEKPKKLSTVDRFVLGEWLERIRSGREYYESKEDLLLLLSFACRWSPDRVCSALKISRSAYYFRLFHAIRLRSPLFKRNSGHLSSACAHYDLRLPEYLVAQNLGLPMNPEFRSNLEEHARTCRRCESLRNFAFELTEMVRVSWVQTVPPTVLEESLSPFVEARNHPIKRNLWTRTPAWVRTVLALAVLIALAYWAFRSKS
ncbi:MAG TPA: hypothetical protein VM901_01320 [Bdellovibrionota bacterium]|jgi:hypothetical protein|nr:hypothetical protein [Bdellovibrionota bacterium]